jgi:ATP-dependent DNA ligase
VRPELVVELRYGQQTADNRLRFPRFLRLRPDLTAAEVGLSHELTGTDDATLDDGGDDDG